MRTPGHGSSSVHAPPTRSRASSTSTRLPRAGEIRGAGEPVVSRPDHDRVPSPRGQRAHRLRQPDAAEHRGGRALPVAITISAREASHIHHSHRPIHLPTPATRPTHPPPGTSFSTSTSPAIATTHSRFITPATNSNAISSQQQPTQKLPCRMPIQSAPHTPSRHSDEKNPSGERQCERQTRLTGSHW